MSSFFVQKCFVQFFSLIIWQCIILAKEHWQKSCLNIFGEIDCSTSRVAGVICSNGTISTTTIKSTTTG